MYKTNTYSTILGGCWRGKVVSVFGFGHSKSHFRAPKMGLRVPKSKIWDHFFMPTSPQNGGASVCFIHLFECVISEFWILNILTSLLECKNGIFYKMVARRGKRPKNHLFFIFGLLSYRHNIYQVRIEFGKLFDISVHPEVYPKSHTGWYNF